MNTFAVITVACLITFANAKPWGHGHGHLPLVGASGVVSGIGAAGPAGIVTGHGAIGPHGIANAVGHGIVGGGVWGHLGHLGHDDGQWHGEGLLESQDWAGNHGAAVVGAHGLALGHGLGYGHGAVIAGPAGTVIADVAHGVVGHHGHW